MDSSLTIYLLCWAVGALVNGINLAWQVFKTKKADFQQDVKLLIFSIVFISIFWPAVLISGLISKLLLFKEIKGK